MKKILAALLVLVATILVWDYQISTKPTRVFRGEVVSLKSFEKGDGAREITVKLLDGSEQVIKTSKPFFYKPGYLANVACYNRRIWPEVCDFVPTPEALP